MQDNEKTREMPAFKPSTDSTRELPAAAPNKEEIPYSNEEITTADNKTAPVQKTDEFADLMDEVSILPGGENSSDDENISDENDSPETNFDCDATQYIEIVTPNADAQNTEKYVAPQYENGNEKSVKQNRIWVPIFTSSIVVILACMAVISSYILVMIQQNGMLGGIAEIITPMMVTSEPPKYTNILLVGTDRDGYRTDAIMVATYDNETESVNIIQIPRDTYVAGNGRADKKVNSAFVGGIDNLKDEIFLALGLEIHNYVSVDLGGFVELVDELGGVEFDVPINMNYDDPEQNLHIHLKKGLQTLDGKDAEGLVRYRKSNNGTSYPRGDLDRMEVQRSFIMKLVEKLVSMEGLTKISELLEIAENNVKTDVSYSDAYAYISKILSVDKENIKFFDTPGQAEYRYGGWYYFVDGAQTKTLISQYFYGDRNKKKHVFAPLPKEDTKPASAQADISEDERYTYYSPTPSSSPDPSGDKPSVSIKPGTSQKPDASQKPGTSQKPDASQKPGETAKPTAEPSAAPTPSIVIKPSAA